ncbi:sodium:proton antiporter [Alginatibacterium sediminis]|uniref:Sodium:proton antiporter n=1 Tax=Alginatibacterium sediminis TaxID=2164068 RepID=A0A420EGJ0_9ALTE|nr:sodium:proton antiporter NhaD [Alginatibacterium sediminis]RKF19831.1 sodium:proton antiporter [Alginatibacterium sediminis]
MRLALLCLLSVVALPVLASESAKDLTDTWVGTLSIVVFTLAYMLVMLEEVIKLRKSKPVLIAAGIIWFMIAGYYHGTDQAPLVTDAFRHNLLEFAELMLFLLVAMTYINAMEERRLFDGLRSWLVSRQLTYRQLFWLTGILAFFISPIADNLTTALLMCAVVMKVAHGNSKLISLACINIVIAANAGGAFSPFGDITTLMVWQKGMVEFKEFFALFIPSIVNFVIPALIMSRFVSAEVMDANNEKVELKRGARRIVALFLLTVATAVIAHSYFHLPPVMGMMTGLGYLQVFGFFLRKTLPTSLAKKRAQAMAAHDESRLRSLGSIVPFDVFNRVARAEWDTLLFFYGVVMCVGGLGFIGYLELVSNVMYTQWDVTYANIAVGILSAIVDNIPVMFAVLTMEPVMSHGQWLLVTLTAGVGGSLLSIGSAAGVALMGQAHGHYTFMSHLRWTPVIALGYIASIGAHLLINGV